MPCIILGATMIKNYQNKLLNDWELIFQQGLLTFWVFIAIRDSEQSVGEIIDKVTELTNKTYNPSEQTIYRLLRKQYDLELVNYREVAGNRGPNKRLYTLSSLGKELLTRFIERNIQLFQQPIIFNSKGDEI